MINRKKSAASLLSNDSAGDLGTLLRCREKEEQVYRTISLCRKTLRRVARSSNVFENCMLENNDNKDDLPFSNIKNGAADIKPGPILGNGTFCDVRALNRRTEFVQKQNDLFRRGDISTHSIGEASVIPSDLTEETTSSCASLSQDLSLDRDLTGAEISCCYAIKKLKPNLQGTKQISGAIDLSVEALFLSKLSHPNIVSFHGTGGTPGSTDFFIIIGQVERTLDSEIIKWRRQRDGMKHNFTRKEQDSKLKLEFHNRLTVALQLVSGLKYLHEQSILHRDLKPANIGLDENDQVKIFDFGLAKELKSKLKVGPNQYMGRSSVGTLRYMAPEVYRGDPYGLPADVYSTALILWGIMDLNTPFKGLSTSQEFIIFTFQKKRRPKIRRDLPKKIKQMLRNTWHDNPTKRPNMIDVYDTIESCF